MKRSCSNCDHLLVEMPCHDQPYLEIACLEMDWEGCEDTSDLDLETDCEKWTVSKRYE